MVKANIIAVVGADGGVGKALVNRLKYGDMGFTDDWINYVIELDHGDVEYDSPRGLRTGAGMILSETDAVYDSSPDFDETNHILVNCVGVNYIEWFPEMDFDQFDRLMNINVKGFLQTVQDLIGGSNSKRPGENWFEGKGHNGTICGIISNASHMAMTNSAFYNASKAAQHMAMMSLAREIRKTHGINVFGISPNKLAGTGMSEYIEGRVPDLRGWTPEEAAKYQLGSLPAQAETHPYTLAEFMAFLLSTPERHRYLTNTVLPYGA